MQLYSFFLLPLLAFSLLTGSVESKTVQRNLIDQKQTYPRNPHVDPGLWNHLVPYFLPYDHPLRPKLDALFSKRVTLNSATLNAAGFVNTLPGKYTKVVVTKHKLLSGYRLKLMTDDNPKEEWHHWQARIDGARVIRQVIEKLGYQKLFKVPKKWIYPLPADPPPPPNYHRKNFILVVEDMKVLKRKANIQAWRLDMEPFYLEALYKVIVHAGLDDSLFPWNVPFLKHGGMAFVDTEQFYRWPIPAHRIHPHLTRETGEFWNKVVQKYGTTKPQ